MTREEAHTRERALIDRHFEQRSTLHDEAAMRAHLSVCDTCRQYYERHLLVADLDPRSPPAKERLAAGLGFGPPPAPARLSRPVFTLAGAAAVFALVVVAGRQLQPEPEFVARGGLPRDDERGLTTRGGGGDARTGAELQVWVVNPDNPPQSKPLGLEIKASDELGFAYSNPEGFRWLMILGVDENRKIYWFHPAWNDRSTNPTAVAIDPGVVPRELPEGITHDFSGRTLRILGLFADRELSVRDVEGVVSFAGCASVSSQLGKVACVETTVEVATANAPG